jgi:hypothetical protein
VAGVDSKNVWKIFFSKSLLISGFAKVSILQEVLLFRLPTFFHRLLGGCNSKATANPPKSEWKKMGNWSELHSEKKYYL